MSSVVRLPRRIYRGAEISRTPKIIDDYDFSSVYQPILSPTHRKLVGYEALVRVRKNNESISPFTLFEQAEKNNQTPELDRHLLQLHLDNFAASSQAVWLFLNINPGTCIHPEASLEKLALQCQRSGIDPEKVVLELVETASDNPAALLEFILKAKAHGFQIAIDDFGTGHSSLAYLRSLPISKIKIDRSFVSELQVNRTDATILKAMIRLAHGLGKRVIAEGIETQDQQDILQQLGCDMMQGYFYSPPIKLELAEQLIENELKLGREPLPSSLATA